MKIAVAILEDGTVATHGGRARHFLLFDAACGVPVPSGRLDLGPDDVLHHFGDGGPHPIDGADLVIAGSSGEGFVKHMVRRGIECVLTAETDPLQAVLDRLAGSVKPAAPMHHPHSNPHADDGHHDHHGHG
ncbi:nitrogenase accessory factor [Azospirillum sp. RWY-5-1]|uniref:Nitrogenase accessory factor n=1 Tax=Azospirillum oleiclasticum TaxID=2735135 RepID=A0ABX2T1Q6_9PROT|nr:nitrogenase accessory factor [Azospirillum oleiclasticum]NYZ10982.1 nitrogenase accessory factor [Azospirillum oleiclasticum]NYZ18144.1 nitrogenase accessory factor [Azospirillum oleiclasticum]